MAQGSRQDGWRSASLSVGQGAVDNDAVRQATPTEDWRQTMPHNVGGPRSGASKE